MIGEIRMNIKKNRQRRTAFSSVSCGQETKERVIDGKFAKLLRHTEPTLPSAMTVQILEGIILLTPPPFV